MWYFGQLRSHSYTKLGNFFVVSLLRKWETEFLILVIPNKRFLHLNSQGEKKKHSLSTVYWQFIQYAYYSLHWLLPDTTEARHLYNYAQSLELLDDPLNNPELSTEGLDREYTCTENIRSEMFG